jgi:hypothetical protein
VAGWLTAGSKTEEQDGNKRIRISKVLRTETRVGSVERPGKRRLMYI